MCLTDKGQEIPVTDQMRDSVLNRHNEIRAAVQPPAANMQKLVGHFHCFVTVFVCVCGGGGGEEGECARAHVSRMNDCPTAFHNE